MTSGGHAAVNLVTETSVGGSTLAIEMTTGTAIVATSSASQSAGVPDPDLCPDAVRIATAIAPLFPWDRPPRRLGRGWLGVQGFSPEPGGVFCRPNVGWSGNEG